jgi:histone acetyltransferase MYST1
MKKKSIELGERYLISWKNGQKHPGDIIEMRPAKKRESIDTQDKNIDDFEYYVHFPSFDRRLDEWVTIDRIDLQNLVVSTVERDYGDRSGVKIKKNKRKSEEANLEIKKDDKEAMLFALEKEHEEITKVKNIQTISLGKYEIDTWYFSPYPEEYAGDEKLFVCEYCLKYMKRQKTFMNHSLKCPMKSPPGLKIYDENGLTMYEVDGKDHKIYCQNLCLLSKLFLDHKTLYYDVDPFLFYILCEADEVGAHIVGYFSKEKQSQENYNLACILTFPPYQRKGYGKFLMSISYELTKRENTTGFFLKKLN